MTSDKSYAVNNIQGSIYLTQRLCSAPFSVTALIRKSPGFQDLWQVVEKLENTSLSMLFTPELRGVGQEPSKIFYPCRTLLGALEINIRERCKTSSDFCFEAF